MFTDQPASNNEDEQLKIAVCTKDALMASLDSKTINIVQFSAPWCTRCPAFTEAMIKLKQQFTFSWLYIDLSVEGTDELKEEFAITRLPAIVVLRYDGTEATPICTKQSVGEEDASACINEHCVRSLVLDADF